MKIYYVIMQNGYGMLFKGDNDIEKAKEAIYRVEGYNNVQHIKEAREKDITWVRAMGGYVP